MKKVWIQNCLHFIFPPLCPLCKDVVDGENTLCPTCWPHIEFIADPCCDQCGLPLATASLHEKEKCISCLQHHFSFTQNRSAILYTQTSKKMILDLKHGHKLSIAPLLAQWMVRSGHKLIEKSDILIPVPLHWTRLLKRGFNQAAVLTQHIGKKTNTPYLLNTLKRVKRTPSQDGLSASARQKNVHHAFIVPNPQDIRGKSLLLIDDVMTTGSTLEACAKVLIQSGAKCVRTLTVGRVCPRLKQGSKI